MPFSLNLPYRICYFCTRLVRRIRPQVHTARAHDPRAYFQNQYESTATLRQRFMSDVPIADRSILDVGSGLGGRSPYWLEQGANRVINIDINRQELETGRTLLEKEFPNFVNHIEFHHPSEINETGFADTAILFDCFEHLTDPEAVLKQVYAWLRPGGVLWIGSFGWYSYSASHCTGHVPILWCQLLFSERAIIHTIQTVIREPDYVLSFWERTEGITRWDNVRTLKDRPGEPLNMLSLRRVRAILRKSPFDMTHFTVHGYSGHTHPGAKVLSFLAKVPVVKEVFHSYYTAVLTKPSHIQSSVHSR